MEKEKGSLQTERTVEDSQECLCVCGGKYKADLKSNALPCEFHYSVFVGYTVGRRKSAGMSPAS
jgi:hypothetical protein